MTDDLASRIVEAERHLAARLEEVEQADADGRLYELVKDGPSVREQLKEFIGPAED